MKPFAILTFTAGLFVALTGAVSAQAQQQAAPMQNMPGMDHSNMPGMANMPGMDHSNMPGMQKSAPAQGTRAVSPAKPSRPGNAPVQPRTN